MSSRGTDVNAPEIRVAVFGATGYTGAELVRLLARHERARLVACTASEGNAGKRLAEVLPQTLAYAPPAARSGLSAMRLVAPRDVDLDAFDLAFLCLPHGPAAGCALPEAARLVRAGKRVIDLGGDYRLKDAGAYETYYGHAHAEPDLLAESVYGLTEHARGRVREARLVANPGCYPTSALLPLLPLLQAGLVDTRESAAPLIIDAKSGVSGAGRKPSVTSLFCEAGENVSPYAVGRAHRHVPEIEQGLRLLGLPSQAGAPLEHAATEAAAPVAHASTRILFSPHLVPVTRGLLSTIYAPLKAGVGESEVRRALLSRYADEPFVVVLEEGQTATMRHAVSSNLCVISVSVCQGFALMVGALDNLVKGAAGQAVQNMNVMYHLPETMGLLEGPFP